MTGFELTSTADSSALSFRGLPLLFEALSLSSDSESPPRLRLREAFAVVMVLLLILNSTVQIRFLRRSFVCTIALKKSKWKVERDKTSK